MKIKQITKRMLKNAAKEFEQWYGVVVPMKVMVGFARTISYDDLLWFDTVSREMLTDYVTEKVLGVGAHWPTGADGEKVSKRFFAKFKKHCGKFGIKAAYD